MTGFQRNLSSYTCVCPICHQQFIPKFRVHCENENNFINGKAGDTI
jgi:hypothetical protein